MKSCTIAARHRCFRRTASDCDQREHRDDQGAPESTRHELQKAELCIGLSGLGWRVRLSRWQPEGSGHGGQG